MKKTIIQLIKSVLVDTGRTRARTELLRMSDSALEDAGFSRLLLEKGNSAWPWRTVPAEPVRNDQTNSANKDARPTARQERKAIRELEQLSNAELADIGIHRAQIRQMVKTGRPGVDDKTQQRAA